MSTPWTPTLTARTKPVYLAIADALEADIKTGKLQSGMRLPPQRALAEILGVDFTTISRAYGEGQRRGLLAAAVGKGTFVRGAAPAAAPALLDMSMNQPPLPADPSLTGRILESMQNQQLGLAELMRYQPPGGSAADRAAGAVWLAPRLAEANPAHLLVFPGAQSALMAIAGTLARAGDLIAADALCYPGFRAVASQLGIGLVGVATDRDGMLPDAFETLCSQHKITALYCNPTLHNPTASTLSVARRMALADIARRHRVTILEDDAYGALAPTDIPPLATLAPDLTYHVSGLAKCVSPALRIAYAVAPDRRATSRLSLAARANTGMLAPLSARLATGWIESGLAREIRDAILTETRSRSQIARDTLPPNLVQTAPEAFHAWLHLPRGWTRSEFTARLHSVGVSVVASDAFALDTPPEAVRIGLGTAPNRTDLQQGLNVIADLLTEPAGLRSNVI